MKSKTILLLSLLGFLFFSCSTVDECQTCTVIVEDNANEARFKCAGLANDYPNGFKETSSITEMICGEDAILAVKNAAMVTTINECSGVEITFRTVVNCIK